MNKLQDKEWGYRLEEERAERFYNHLPKFLARLMQFRHWSLTNEGMTEKVEIFFRRNFGLQMEWVASQRDSSDPLTRIVAHRYWSDIELALMLLLGKINNGKRVNLYISLCSGSIFMQHVIEMEHVSQTARSLACCYIIEMGSRIKKIRDLIYHDSWEITSKMTSKKGRKPTK
jgi:hypothetical protein